MTSCARRRVNSATSSSNRLGVWVLDNLVASCLDPCLKPLQYGIGWRAPESVRILAIRESTLTHDEMLEARWLACLHKSTQLRTKEGLNTICSPRQLIPFQKCRSACISCSRDIGLQLGNPLGWIISVLPGILLLAESRWRASFPGGISTQRRHVRTHAG
jgi:hypothetical protein